MFLSIITRCHPKRPTMLAFNQLSLDYQTDHDFEQLLIKDDSQDGRGVGWANGQLQHAEPAGEYVLILDDDDRFIDNAAVEKLKAATIDRPDIVIFKADHAKLGILPSPAMWGKRPVGGHIGSCDFITRVDVWREHIAAFDMPECGDYAFLKALWSNDIHVVWLDEKLAEVQRISKGAAE